MTKCNCIMCLAEGDNSPHNRRRTGEHEIEREDVEKLDWICRNPANCNYSYCGCWAGNLNQGVDMNERWFVRHRQDWIAETVRVFGFINREHLERKFWISTPQASVDIALYMHEQPGAITYNKSAKRYEVTP